MPRPSKESLREELAEIEATFRSFEGERKGIVGATIRSVADSYQRLCQRFAYLNTFFPNTPETEEAQRLVQHGRRLIYGRRLTSHQLIGRGFLTRVPRAFAALRGYCLFAFALALVGGLLTALIVDINPGFGWYLISEDAVEGMRAGKLWTEDVKNMSSLASSQIATNNIGVAFAAFACGIAAGFLTVFIILLNGAMIGGIFVVVGQYGMAMQLLDFIVAHGFIELSIIFVSAGCGLYLGDAIIRPGLLTRKAALQSRARQAVDVVLFSAACLIPSGLVEGYISPRDFGFVPKLSLGIFLGALYWWFLLVPAAKDRKKPRL